MWAVLVRPMLLVYKDWPVVGASHSALGLVASMDRCTHSITGQLTSQLHLTTSSSYQQASMLCRATTSRDHQDKFSLPAPSSMSALPTDRSSPPPATHTLPHQSPSQQVRQFLLRILSSVPLRRVLKVFLIPSTVKRIPQLPHLILKQILTQ